MPISRCFLLPVGEKRKNHTVTNPSLEEGMSAPAKIDSRDLYRGGISSLSQ